jgi:nucleotide-binding universal stress UspA family protein
MAYRTILVELQRNGSMEARVRTARALAQRSEAVLIGMHVMPTPVIPASFGEAAAYLGPEVMEAQRRASLEVKDQVHDTFERICGTGRHAVWREAEGEAGRLLAGAAHCADLVVAAKRDLSGLDGPAVVEELTLSAGVPVLMLPPDAPEAFGRTVVVGWNGSREAARAVHEGLPLLREAERVFLLAVGETAADGIDAGAAMLQRHGVTIEPQPIEASDGDAGEVLLAQAAAHGADLLVMGAYGHSRLRELVFGGATRHVLREASLPVLFGS